MLMKTYTRIFFAFRHIFDMFEKIPLISGTSFGREMPSGNALFLTLLSTADLSRKMSKSTNKNQMEVLIARMQENADIARGFVKENRGVVAAFWKKLALELNSAGPPEKSEAEWKKVWNDQKRYVRKKASLNRIYERGTGGGPNKTQKLLQLEEAIFELISIKKGVDTSRCYGLKPVQSHTRNEGEVTPAVCDTDICSEEVAGIFYDLIENKTEASSGNCKLNNTIPNETTPAPKKLNAFVGNQPSSANSAKMSTNEVVLKELMLQEELCDKVGQAVTAFKSQSKEMQYASKKIYKAMECLEHQKSLQLQEMKRHNHEMEKLREKEIESHIEYNRKLIELKELKLRIQAINRLANVSADRFRLYPPTVF